MSQEAHDVCRQFDQDQANEAQTSLPDLSNPRPSTLVRPEYRTEAPTYLVLTSEGSLAGYMRSDILKCDLAINKRLGDPALQVFKLNKGWTIAYTPIAVEEIRDGLPEPESENDEAESAEEKAMNAAEWRGNAPAREIA